MRYGKIKVTGKFQCGGRYGHLGGFSAQIIPLEVEFLAWAPEELPAWKYFIPRTIYPPHPLCYNDILAFNTIKDEDLVYYVSMMAKEDVSQVMEIDREAFSTQLPVPDYYHELENRLAHYIVASDTDIVEEPAPENPSRRGIPGLASRLKQTFVQDSSRLSSRYILGFAGFWIMADEAHITSIAIREKYRRRGIGELLLICLIELARELKAAMVTLEVRVSNAGAQTLYLKYGFLKVGVRHGYYTDNGEDALLMTLQDINLPSVRDKTEDLKQAHARRWSLDLSVYQIAQAGFPARSGSQ